jgi:hypothetical protein
MIWQILQVLAGWYLADFGGALIHYAFDHGQRFDRVPLIGTMVRDFANHHRNADSSIGLGFWEICWHSIVVALLMSPGIYFYPWFFGSICLAAACTQQIHQWAHVEAAYRAGRLSYRAPLFARAMQRVGIFISPETHGTHHAPPFEQTFGVLNAWSNWPLNWILGRR